MESELLSKDEATRRLGGISVTMLDRLRATGELTTIRVHGHLFVCARSLAAYIERQRTGSPGRAALEQAFPIPRLDALRRASRERRGEEVA